MGCAWHDVKCHLKDTPLGGIAAALDKPLQAASGAAAQALKGTPLENAAKAFNLINVGKANQAASTAVRGALDIVKAYVPAIGSIPGIGMATDLATSMVDNALSGKKGAALSVQTFTAAATNIVSGAAQGALSAAGVPLPNLASIVKNTPLGPLLKPIASVPVVPPRVAPTATNNSTVSSTAIKLGAQAVVQSQAPTLAPPPTVPVSTKRKPRMFASQDQFRAFAGQAATVGGTQPWAVP